MEAEEALEEVHQVHQKVVDEAVEDEGVEEGNQRPPLEDRPLGEGEPKRPPDALGQAVKAVLGTAPPDGQVDPAEAGVGVVEACRHEEDEEDFFR